MCDDKIYTAVLEGWGKPVFPELLEDLRLSQVNNRVLTWDQLREAGNLVSGYFHSDKPMTSDRYFWYFALYFIQGKNQAAVLFPWHQDHSAENKSDRSIAVYKKGDFDVNRLMSELIPAMNKVGKKILLADLEECDVSKVEPLILNRYKKPDAHISFSGTTEGYVRYLAENNLVGDQYVDMLVQIDNIKNWDKCDKTGMNVLSKIGTIWAIKANFRCLVSLMKNKSIVKMER